MIQLYFSMNTIVIIYPLDNKYVVKLAATVVSYAEYTLYRTLSP